MAGATGRGVPRELMQRNRQQIGAVAASNIPRIQYSTGAASALASFSRDMFAVSARAERQLDQEAEAEARVEGAVDGVSGNFNIREYSTIRGRAYNQAGIEATVTTLETRAIVKQAELEEMYSNNPVKLKEELENYHAGVRGEIERVSPGAGAVYNQQQTARMMPAIERAKDAAYKLTRDQADAALIENQAAIQSEIKSYASDLFSENPARSQAAAQAIGVVQSGVTRIFNATDPTTGRPLYSAKERAVAKTKFYDEVMSTAALSWFDDQEDKAAAYMRFSDGKFEIDVQTDPATVDIVDGTEGKIRDKPITQKVRNQISTAAAATGSNIGVMLVSGGQNPLGVGGKRTGSTRHDDGHAGDVVLLVDGEQVTPDQAPELYEKFLENAAATGATGIGHYPWGVHIGGGKRSAWGPNKKSNTLDPRFGEAIKRGWANPIDTAGGSQKVDLFEALSDSARDKLDSEMRSRITFQNGLVDRSERQAEKRHTDAQDASGFELSDRLFNGGKEVDGVTVPPLTREDVLTAVQNDEISANQGEAFLKALVSPKAEISDSSFLDELNARMYAGEDVTQLILQNSERLTNSDSATYLAKNRTMNVLGEGTLSKDQQFQQDRLKDTLTPDSLMAPLDPSSDVRKFAALDEYRQRVAEGEPAREVANELSERAARDFENVTRTKLDRLIFPRFSVEAGEGRIDVAASKEGLKAAYAAGKISEASFKRQAALLREWATLQQVVKK